MMHDSVMFSAIACGEGYWIIGAFHLSLRGALCATFLCAAAWPYHILAVVADSVRLVAAFALCLALFVVGQHNRRVFCWLVFKLPTPPGALLFIVAYGTSFFLPKHPYIKPSEIAQIRKALSKKK
jgi:hypothetical protein